MNSVTIDKNNKDRYQLSTRKERSVKVISTEQKNRRNNCRKKPGHKFLNLISLYNCTNGRKLVGSGEIIFYTKVERLSHSKMLKIKIKLTLFRTREKSNIIIPVGNKDSRVTSIMECTEILSSLTLTIPESTMNNKTKNKNKFNKGSGGTKGAAKKSDAPGAASYTNVAQARANARMAQKLKEVREANSRNEQVAAKEIKKEILSDAEKEENNSSTKGGAATGLSDQLP